MFALKADVEHLIKLRPHAEAFLKKLANSHYHVVMVTNAHQKLVKMKMDRTGIDIFFDEIIRAHELGHAKEESAFWKKLQSQVPFQIEQTLLVDDNLTVLRTAREYGVKHLLTIAKPDSQNAMQDPEEFDAIHSFQDIISQIDRV